MFRSEGCPKSCAAEDAGYSVATRMSDGVILSHDAFGTKNLSLACEAFQRDPSVRPGYAGAPSRMTTEGAKCRGGVADFFAIRNGVRPLFSMIYDLC
jgi:hypothetical protein